MKSQFDGLLEEIEVLAKAAPPEGDEGDKKIAAAAADSGVEATGEVDGEKAGDKDLAEGAAEGEAVIGDKSLTKSFSLKLEDGTEVDAIDGTELVKALMARVETTENDLVEAGKVIKAQTGLLKSFGDKLQVFASAGKGRKVILSVAEKTGAVVSEPTGIKPEEFMVKALAAQAAGKLTGTEVCIADNRLQKGVLPDQRIIDIVGAFVGA